MGEIFIEEKTCTKCGITKPATLEYFYKDTKGKLSQPCKECRKKYQSEYQKGNENYIEWNRRYREKNRKLVNERTRKWMEKNRERFSAYFKNYQRENKEKFSEYSSKRRNKNHNITKEEWNYCKEFFDDSCAYCGMLLDDHKRKYKQDLHKEHVVHDGADDISNCVPSCKNCNSQKWEFPLEEWYSADNPKFDTMRLQKIQEWLKMHKTVQ